MSPPSPFADLTNLRWARPASILKAAISFIAADPVKDYTGTLMAVGKLPVYLDLTMVSEKGGSCVLHWICEYIGKEIWPPVISNWLFSLPKAQERINMKTRKGNTPLHILLSTNLKSTSGKGKATEGAIWLFLKMVKQGADLDLANNDGWTCRDLIHYKISLELRNILLDRLSELES